MWIISKKKNPRRNKSNLKKVDFCGAISKCFLTELSNNIVFYTQQLYAITYVNRETHANISFINWRKIKLANSTRITRGSVRCAMCECTAHKRKSIFIIKCVHKYMLYSKVFEYTYWHGQATSEKSDYSDYYHTSILIIKNGNVSKKKIKYAQSLLLNPPHFCNLCAAFSICTLCADAAEFASFLFVFFAQHSGNKRDNTNSHTDGR